MNIADLESQVSARKWRPLRAPLFLYGFGLVINAATNTASACDCAVSPPTAFTAPKVADIVLEVEVLTSPRVVYGDKMRCEVDPQGDSFCACRTEVEARVIAQWKAPAGVHLRPGTSRVRLQQTCSSCAYHTASASRYFLYASVAGNNGPSPTLVVQGCRSREGIEPVPANPIHAAFLRAMLTAKGAPH